MWTLHIARSLNIYCWEIAQKNIVLTKLMNVLSHVIDASIDFLQHYRLVDPQKIEIYAKPFIVEDDDFKGVINARVI